MQVAKGADWPAFLFQVQEITRSASVEPRRRYGIWLPPTRHRLVRKGINSCLFLCDGKSITQQGETEGLQPDCEAYSTFSMYRIETNVFALPGDVLKHEGALGPVSNEEFDAEDTEEMDHWQQITFAHRQSPRSSYVGYNLPSTQLIAQRPNVAWTRQLIPSACHAQTKLEPDSAEGGLDGELAILLGLMRFCEDPASPVFSTFCILHHGMWYMKPPTTPSASVTQPRSERGLVIRVWPCPGKSDAEGLRRFENMADEGKRIFD